MTETYDEHMAEMLRLGGAHECASDCPLPLPRRDPRASEVPTAEHPRPHIESCEQETVVWFNDHLRCHCWCHDSEHENRRTLRAMHRRGADPAEHPSGHVPGCRMPGCEGECTTDSGLSPAEERMLAEWPEHPSGSPQTEAGRFLHDRCGYLLACPCWTDGATAGQAAARREPLDMERPTRDELIEALIWMTGSDHFSPGGMAHEGFEKVVRPVLRALSSIPAREEK